MSISKRFRSLAAPLVLVMMVGLTAAPLAASAQLGGVLSNGLNKAAPKELKGATDLNAIIGNLISAVIGFLGVVLFLYLLYGGFLWMTAGGDAGQVKKATDVIRNAIIGLVIIALSYAIATFVITSLGTAVSQGSQGAGGPSNTP
ncbi:MAG: pilin [Patescibacteria group bacterium]